MKSALTLFIALITCIALADTNECDAPYAGVGLVISTNGAIQVMRVAKDSPADEAGLHSFDSILRIGDADTKGMSLTTATSLIKGPEGTSVVLLIKSITNDANREVQLVRCSFPNPATITWKSEVLTSMQLPGGTNMQYSLKEETNHVQQPPSPYAKPEAAE